MAKRAYQVDANISVRCAVLANEQTDAKEKTEAELHRLLTGALVSGIYLTIKEIHIKPAERKDDRRITGTNVGGKACQRLRRCVTRVTILISRRLHMV